MKGIILQRCLNSLNDLMFADSNEVEGDLAGSAE